MNRLRVPLARKGEWFHEKYGTVRFDDNDFSTIIDNFSRNSLGFEPFITYGHVPSEPNSTDDHFKKGKLEALTVSGDTLFGDFQVKDDTAALVQSGDYEYASGEFIRNYLDKQTGKRAGTAFMRVALTNTPFIPFNHKLEILSTTATDNDCIQTVIPFVINLSTSTPLSHIDMPVNPELDKTLSTEAASTTPASAPVAVTATPVIPTVAVATPAPAAASTPTGTSPAVTSEAASSAITAQLLEEITALKSLYKEAVDKATQAAKQEAAQAIQVVQQDAAVLTGRLQEEIEVLKQRLAGQEKFSQSYADLTNKANERALYGRLSELGLAPTLIQKFSQVKSAIDEANLTSSTIKLSTSAGETPITVTLVEAVANLLIDAVKSQPVPYDIQLGMTAGSAGSTNPATAAIRDIIARNSEQAKKLMK